MRRGGCRLGDERLDRRTLALAEHLLAVSLGECSKGACVRALRCVALGLRRDLEREGAQPFRHAQPPLAEHGFAREPSSLGERLEPEAHALAILAEPREAAVACLDREGAGEGRAAAQQRLLLAVEPLVALLRRGP